MKEELEHRTYKYHIGDRVRITGGIKVGIIGAVATELPKVYVIYSENKGARAQWTATEDEIELLEARLEFPKKPQKVYVVYDASYDDFELVSVHRSEEKAKSLCPEDRSYYNNCYITEYKEMELED